MTEYAAFIQGISGALIGSGVVLIWLRSRERKIIDLEQTVNLTQEKRLVKLEKANDECGGARQLADHAARIQALEVAMHHLDTNFAGVKITLDNQTETFRGMNANLARYIELTTRQDERIENIRARLDGLHKTVRQHTDREK